MENALRGRLILELHLTNAHTRVYEHRERLFLAKRSGESLRHVMMKLVSYLALYRPGLLVEVGVGQHYKPDLVATTEQGLPTFWVDCGQTSIRKLVEVARRNPAAQVVIVKPDERALEHYRRQAEPRLPPGRVAWLTADDGFFELLGERLGGGRHTLAATVTDGPDYLYLDVNGEPLSTRLKRWGAPLL